MSDSYLGPNCLLQYWRNSESVFTKLERTACIPWDSYLH